jgi:hypothetical protein
MKRHILYSSAALVSLVLAGCNGDYDDWASPQGYDQEAAAEAYGVTVSAGSDANITMPVSNDDVNLVALSASSSEVTGFTVRKLFVNGTEVSSKVSNGNVVVSAAELNSLVQTANFSRAHKTYDLAVELAYAANLANGDAVALSATTPATITTQVTPDVDENGYFLLGDFVENGWDATNPVWMTNNGDGTYTAIVNTKSDGSNWFKFYQGSHFVSGDWDSINEGQMGCAENGDDSAKGLIVWNGDAEHADGVQTPTITGVGKYDVTIDAINYTYTVAPHADYLYYKGDANSWGATVCPLAMWNDNFVGFYYVNAVDNASTWGFKLTTDADSWDPQYGQGATAGTLNLCTNGANADNINLGQADGFYEIIVNTTNLTIELVPITRISLIGSAVNGDTSWGTDYDLTFNTSTMAWEGTFDMTAGEYKFRANHEWNISWGGSEDALTADNGSNLSITAGNYTFSFKPNANGLGTVKITKN